MGYAFEVCQNNIFVFSDTKKPVVTARRREPIQLATLPCEAIAYLAINTFGLSMIYPGSVKLLQKLMSKKDIHM